MKAKLRAQPIFFAMLAVYVFFNIDLSMLRLARIAGMNVYYGDLFLFLVLAVAAWEWRRGGKAWRGAHPAAIGYLLFLGWLVVEVFLGWRIYGHRALGESRYILPFFAFFLPYALSRGQRRDETAQAAALIRAVTIVAAAASLLFLACSLVYRRPFYFSATHVLNQQNWLYKIVSSDQSFHIIALAMFLFLMSFSRKAFFSFPKIVFFLMLFVALPMHNRTALISLCASFLVLLALQKRFREMAFACLSVAVILAMMRAVPGVERLYYPVPDAERLGITGMNTWNWRLELNKSALLQIKEKPVVGHHFGGYFSFFLSGTGEISDLPPHNQYILTLLKAGAIGLLLLLAPLLLLLWGLGRFLADERLQPEERSAIWLLLLVLLAQLPYGMAFGFIPLYAVYFGFGTILLGALRKKYPDRLGAMGPDSEGRTAAPLSFRPDS